MCTYKIIIKNQENLIELQEVAAKVKPNRPMRVLQSAINLIKLNYTRSSNRSKLPEFNPQNVNEHVKLKLKINRSIIFLE